MKAQREPMSRLQIRLANSIMLQLASYREEAERINKEPMPFVYIRNDMSGELVCFAVDEEADKMQIALRDM